MGLFDDIVPPGTEPPPRPAGPRRGTFDYLQPPPPPPPEPPGLIRRGYEGFKNLYEPVMDVVGTPKRLIDENLAQPLGFRDANEMALHTTDPAAAGTVLETLSGYDFGLPTIKGNEARFQRNLKETAKTHPDAARLIGATGAAANTAGLFLGGLVSDPATYLLPGSGAVSKAAGLAFLPGMGIGAYEGGKRAIDLYNEAGQKITPEGAEAATEAALSGAMFGLTAHHLAQGKQIPSYDPEVLPPPEGSRTLPSGPRRPPEPPIDVEAREIPRRLESEYPINAETTVRYPGEVDPNAPRAIEEWQGGPVGLLPPGPEVRPAGPATEPLDALIETIPGKTTASPAEPRLGPRPAPLVPVDDVTGSPRAREVALEQGAALEPTPFRPRRPPAAPTAPVPGEPAPNLFDDIQPPPPTEPVVISPHEPNNLAPAEAPAAPPNQFEDIQPPPQFPQSSEPPAAGGTVRLYRVELPPDAPRPGAPEWVKGHGQYERNQQAMGRWFTDDPAEAQFYLDDSPGAHVVALDVPADQAERYRLTNLPEVPGGKDVAENPRAFSQRPEKEFFLPAELAGGKLPVPFPDRAAAEKQGRALAERQTEALRPQEPATPQPRAEPPIEVPRPTAEYSRDTQTAPRAFKMPRQSSGYELVTVDPAKLDRAWGNSSFRVGATGENQIGRRVENFQKWLKAHPEEPIEAPTVGLGAGGEIHFSDGRHRFAVMRDAGWPAIQVAVPKREAARFAQLAPGPEPAPTVPTPEARPEMVAAERARLEQQIGPPAEGQVPETAPAQPQVPVPTRPAPRARPEPPAEIRQALADIEAMPDDGLPEFYNEAGRRRSVPELQALEAAGKVPRGTVQKFEDWWSESGGQAAAGKRIGGEDTEGQSVGALYGITYKGRPATRSEILKGSPAIHKRLVEKVRAEEREREQGHINDWLSDLTDDQFEVVKKHLKKRRVEDLVSADVEQLAGMLARRAKRGERRPSTTAAGEGGDRPGTGGGAPGARDVEEGRGPTRHRDLSEGGDSEGEGGGRVEARRAAYRATDQLRLDFGRPGVARALHGVASAGPTLRGLEAGSGVRTVGLSVSLPRELQERGWIDLRGRRVVRPTDLAVLAQVYRDPRYETFRIFYTKGGEIVAHEGITSRIPESVVVFDVGRRKRDLHHIKERMRRSGADGYWLLHNHPSGQPKPSPEDVALTHAMSREVPGFQGHVIIDGDSFGTIEHGDQGGLMETDIENLPKDVVDLEPYFRPTEIPGGVDVAEKGGQVRTPYDLARFGNALRSGTPDSYVTLIHTDSAGFTRAVQEMPAALFAKTKEAGDYIRGQRRAMGGGRTFAYHPSGPKWETSHDVNTQAALKLFRAGALDDAVIGRGVPSLLSKGYEPPKEDYSKAKRYRVAEEKPTYERTKEGDQALIPGSLQAATTGRKRTEGREAEGPLFTQDKDKAGRELEAKEKKAQGSLFEEKAPYGKKEPAPTFYSHLERVAAKVPQAMSGADLQRYLKGKGVKAAEMKWTGLDDFLKEKGKVAPQELREFVAQNKVEVQEVELGGGKDSERAERIAEDTQANLATALEDALRQRDDSADPLSEALQVATGVAQRRPTARSRARNVLGEGNPLIEGTVEAWRKLEVLQKPPKFDRPTLKLAGGTNYRELLLTLPPVRGRFKAISERIDEITNLPAKEHAAHPELRDEFDRLMEEQRKARPQAPFTGGHYDEPNVLAHVRFDDHTDAEGKKVLVAQEFQSDWAQKGRKEGFGRRKIGADGLPEGWRLSEDRLNVYDERGRLILSGDRPRDVEHDLPQILAGYATGGGPPEAPFVGETKDWTALALKRMLRYAAEHGYDRLAWTTGEQQAERYDLSKQVNKILYRVHNASGTYEIQAVRKGRESEGPESLGKHKEGALSGVVGKDLAKRMVAKEGEIKDGPGGGKWLTFSGLDLKVGGEGMKAYYDQITPQVANDLAKKWGVKVGETRINTGGIDSDLNRATQQRFEARLFDAGLNHAEINRISETWDRGGRAQAMAADPGAVRNYETDFYAASTEPLHSIDITPEMRESVTGEGFALFEEKKPYGKAEPEEYEPELTALHNLTPENLRRADQLGGLAMPSIAITRGKVHEGYGGITLVGDRKMIDPEHTPENKVYPADAYTGRFPETEYKAKRGAADAFLNKVPRKEFYELGDEGFDKLRKSPAEALYYAGRSNSIKAAFLRERGKKAEPVMRAKPLRYPFSSDAKLRAWAEEKWAKGDRLYELRPGDPGWKEFTDQVTGAVERYSPDTDPEFNSDLRDSYRKDALDEDTGELHFGPGNRIIDDLQAQHENKPELDRRATEADLDAALAELPHGSYEEWLHRKIEPLFAGEFIKLGRRKVPVTLESVMEALARNGSQQGKEKGMTFGPGHARAVGSRPIGSMQEMRNRREKIVPDEEFQGWKDKNSKLQDAMADALLPFAEGDTWGAMDSMYRAVAGALRGTDSSPARLRRELSKNGFHNVSHDAIEKAVAVVKSIMNAPTEYFEAKPERAVMLNEFAGAAIPDNAPPYVREILEKHGVRVQEYETGGEDKRVNASRQEAVDTILADAPGAVFEEKAPYGAPKKEREGPFYSHLERVAEKIPQTMKGSDLLRFLQGKGVKAEELKWTGTKAFLEKAGSAKVTPEEFQRHVSENLVKIEEVSSGKQKLEWIEDDRGNWSAQVGTSPWEKWRIRQTERGTWELDTGGDPRPFYTLGEAQANAKALADSEPVATTHYDRPELNLPGPKKNYRELRLTFPGKPTKVEFPTFEDWEKAEITPDYRGAPFERENRRTYEGDRERARLEAERGRNRFLGPHAFKEANIVVHVRMDERTDAAGKKVLVIQEIQSDWGKAGREQGFASPEPGPPELPPGAKVVDFGDEDTADFATTDRFGVFLENGTMLAKGNVREEVVAAAARRHRELQGGSSVPEGPFVMDPKEYAGLALKRMLYWAAEHGYDKVAWTTGDQQAERYKLSKKISEVHYSGSNLKAYDHEGETVLSLTGVTPKELPDHIGKEAAERLLAQKPRGTLRSLEGEDLNIGGEGMRAFYDEIVPSAMRGLVKKYGVKVGSTKLHGPEGGEWVSRKKPDGSYRVELALGGGTTFGPYETRAEADRAAERHNAGDGPLMNEVHSVDVPPEMREGIKKEGFALFEEKEPYAAGGAPPKEPPAEPKQGFLFDGDEALERLRKAGRGKAHDLGSAAATGAGVLRDTTIYAAHVVERMARAAAGAIPKFGPWAKAFLHGLKGVVKGLGGLLQSLYRKAVSLFRGRSKAAAEAEAPRGGARAAKEAPPKTAAGGGAVPPRKPPSGKGQRDYVGGSPYGKQGPTGPGRYQESGIPFLITREMREELGRKGFSEPEIDRMTPEAAWRELGRRVEQDVRKTRRAEGRAGIPHDRLDRETARGWDRIDPEVKRVATEYTDEKFYDVMKRRQLDDAEVQAWTARVKGKEEQLYDARSALQDALKGGNEKAIAEARFRFAAQSADYVAAMRALINDGTGTARALAARNRLMEAVKSGDEALLHRVFKEIHGITDEQAAELVRILHEDPLALGEALNAAMKPGLFSKWLELWKAGLVSGPGTHVANTLGNIGEQVFRLGETGTAAIIDALLPGKSERFSGEAKAEFLGAFQNLGPALRRLGADFDTMFKLKPEPINPRKSLEWQVPKIGGKFGRAVRIPFRALEAMDNFFKVMGGHAELAKLAFREAKGILGEGAKESAVLEKAEQIRREAYNYEHPNYEKWTDLRRAVEQSKLDRTFQNEMPRWAKTADIARSRHKWLHMIIPFLQTPANIAAASIRRSPLGFIDAHRAMKEFRAGEITKGQLADRMAPAVLGTAVMTLFMGLAKAGMMTGSGPVDEDKKRLLKRTGWLPYSFVFPKPGGEGNFYLPFNRFEPASSLLGFAADAIEAKDVKSGEDLISKGAGSIVQNVMSKTFWTGITDAAAATSRPSQFMGQYMRNIAGSAVPNVFAKMAQAIDPVIRDTKGNEPGIKGLPLSIGKTLVSRLPFASKSLRPAVSGTGENITRPGYWFERFASPAIHSETKGDAGLERALIDADYVPSPPQRTITVPGTGGKKVMLTDDEYQRYVEADRKMTERLRKIVSDRRFQRMDAEAKKSFLEKRYKQASDDARRRVLPAAVRRYKEQGA